MMASLLSEPFQHLLDLEFALKDALQQTHDIDRIVSMLSDAATRHGQALDIAALRQALDVVRPISQLAKADPELAQALKEADSTRQAVEWIQRAARRREIEIEIGPKISGARELDDAELEHAVGGFLIESLVVAGIVLAGAAIVSIGAMPEPDT